MRISERGIDAPSLTYILGDVDTDPKELEGEGRGRLDGVGAKGGK